MGIKVCSVCGGEKDLSEFTMTDKTFRIYNSECKKCERKLCKTCNIEKPLSDFWAGRECKKCIGKRNYQRKRIYMQDPEFRRKNNLYLSERIKRLRKEKDPRVVLYDTLRSSLKQAFKRKSYTKNSRTFDVLGIDCVGLIKHFESQFDHRMNWNNHRLIDGWHVDHIVPWSFGMNYEEIIKLNHYTNLRPLWWDENMEKKDSIPIFMDIPVYYEILEMRNSPLL